LYYTPEEGGKQWLFFHLGQQSHLPGYAIHPAIIERLDELKRLK